MRENTLEPRTLTTTDWRYSCIDCGQCCRRWHVELSSAEAKRLDTLEWDGADQIPEKRTVRISGNTYIAHRDDDTCIYYDPEKENCLIHSRHSYASKPLGCKVYPFSIAPTFGNECTLIARFDCPAVRQCEGKPLKKQLAAARGYIPDLGLGKGFDSYDLGGLKPEKVQELVAAFLKYLLNSKIEPVDRMIVLQSAVQRMENLGVAFINDIDMQEIFPSFFERLISDRAQERVRRLGTLEQMRFISLLSTFLRRDEEVVGKGTVARLKRASAFVRLYSSKANLHDLGEEHPDFAMSRQVFFGTPVANIEELEFKLMFDLLRERLVSYQFFGAACYNRSFFFGLKSLFMLVPLIFGLAKWSALVRKEGKVCEISDDDIDYAVGAIDHAYGRSALIGMGFMNSLQRQVADAGSHARLVEELIKPKG